MKKNIAVVAGGNSSEYVVSINSAAEIAKVIDKEKYNVYTVVIKGDEWLVRGNLFCDLVLSREDFSFTFNNQKTKFDCAVIMIHGTPGEDGILQGYFEALGIPYTSSGVLASALTFNKLFSKQYVQSYDIPLAKYVYLTSKDSIDTDEIINYLGLPCFVKPNKGGSSFGISKVKTKEELLPALEHAFKEDDEILIEEFLDGVELTCGLIKTKEKSYVFPPTEIVSKNEFFDYDAKYNGEADEITPARITKTEMNAVQQLSSQIYDWLSCHGIVRIDYLMKDDKLYLIEVNTVPGMSAASIVPQQAEAYGMTTTELFSMAMDDAIHRVQ